MKLKTIIIAAVSLATAGISQAIVPLGTEFHQFSVIMPTSTSGGSSSPQTIQVNPGTNSPNALPSKENIGAITIVMNLSVSSTLDGSADQATTSLYLEVAPEIILENATFNYSTDGSNGLSATANNTFLNVAADEVKQVTASDTTTETWTITDIDAFFNDVPESFQVRGRTFTDIQAAVVGGEQATTSQTTDPRYTITGTAYYTLVPEPSSAALGALGMSMILLRRRR